MYVFLDKFFFVFHTLIIVFNLFGWTWKKTRKANLAVLLLTAFSWFVLGIWYGIGFCFCTEWHYQVRMELGDYDMPYSYVKFLIDSLTGLEVNAKLVDIFTAVFFFLALIASIYTNLRDRRDKAR
jgi:small-conductance mechanosensitive channel